MIDQSLYRLHYHLAEKSLCDRETALVQLVLKAQ